MAKKKVRSKKKTAPARSNVPAPVAEILTRIIRSGRDVSATDKTILAAHLEPGKN